jgi:hypothetical protein
VRTPRWQTWVVPRGATARDVTFERKFSGNPQALTVVIVPGKTHDPLVQDAERASLAAWLNQRVPQKIVPGQNGFNYESVLPDIQQRLKK